MGTMSETATSPASRDDLYAVLAVRIDDVRDHLDISVPDLADRIDRDRSHLWRVLRGEATLTPDVAARCLREMANVIMFREAEAVHG